MRFAFVFFALTLVLGIPSAPAQDAEGQEQMDQMMKMWEQISTPAEQHTALNDMVGSWETRSTMWFDPETPMVTNGKSEMKWILGGRFLMQEFTGELMGKPFSGVGLIGYDIYNRKYVGFWVDNSSTAMFTMEGAFDKSGTVLTMYGKSDDWVTGERDKTIKYVTRLKGKDASVFEIYDLTIGDDAKMMEIEYTRKK